jgi:hypothetical protein
MKKLYFSLFTLLITAISFGQVIITEIADPDDNAGARYIEIFNPTASAVDLTNWNLKRWTNANSAVTESSAISLTPLGNFGAGAFAVIAANATEFLSVYGFAADIDGGTGGPADSNGDDQMAIFDASDTIIDIFGVPGEDGSGTCHEFEDGRAERKGSAMTSKSTWDEADWNVWADSAVGGCTSHMTGAQTALGIFDPGSWIGTSTDPTLALSDAPPSGSSITLSEEGVNATIDFVTTNFVMSSDAGGGTGTGGDGFIKWTGVNVVGLVFVDGGNIFTSNDGFEYPITGLSVGNTYLLTAELVNNAGASLVPAVTYTLTVTIAAYVEVANLAALRAGTVSDEVFYKVTGEVFKTFSRSNRNQKYLQDATGGILVDDEFFEISTVYNDGDGITNIRGYLSLFNGLMQFVPTEADWGAATSTGNEITPQVITLADIIANLNTYESKLVRFNNVTFADGNGVNVFDFGFSGTNYVINDGTASTFRTNFSESDYIGQLIPTGSTSFAAIVGSFNGTPQVTARSLSDMTLSVVNKSLNEFAVFPNPTSLGYVNISSRSQTAMKVKVFDIIGKQVINETITNNRLNVSSLNTGVYIMRISQNNATVTKKLIIN